MSLFLLRGHILKRFQFPPGSSCIRLFLKYHRTQSISSLIRLAIPMPEATKQFSFHHKRLFVYLPYFHRDISSMMSASEGSIPLNNYYSLLKVSRHNRSFSAQEFIICYIIAISNTSNGLTEYIQAKVLIINKDVLMLDDSPHPPAEEPLSSNNKTITWITPNRDRNGSTEYMEGFD